MSHSYTSVMTAGAFILAVLSSPPAQAQVAVQRTLDFEVFDNHIHHVVRTTDGGTVISTTINFEDVLTKYDQALDPLWAVTVENFVMGPGANGGVLAAIYAGSYVAFPDTGLMFFDLLSLDAGGTPAWSKRLTLNVGSTDVTYINLEPEIWSDALGNIFLSAFGDPAGQTSHVVSTDAAGQARWAARFRDMHVEKLCPDGTGGCHILGRSTSGDGAPLHIAHVDAAGQVSYHRSIDFPPQYGVQVCGAQMVSNELVLFINLYGTAAMLRIDAAGDPVDCDLYSPDPPPGGNPYGVWTGSVMANGEVLLVGAVTAKTTFFRIDANDDPIAGHSFNRVTQGDWQRTYGFEWFTPTPDGVTGFGYLQDEELVFQLTFNHPFLMHLPNDVSVACGAVPYNFAHLSFPVAQLDVAPLTDHAVLTLTSDAVTMPVATYAPFVAGDFCALLVGVPDAATATAGSLITLAGNMLQAGDVLTVRSSEDVALRVLDAAGRTVSTAVAGKGRPAELATTWTPGMYVVNALTAEGRSESEKIVVLR